MVSRRRPCTSTSRAGMCGRGRLALSQRAAVRPVSVGETGGVVQRFDNDLGIQLQIAARDGDDDVIDAVMTEGFPQHAEMWFRLLLDEVNPLSSQTFQNLFRLTISVWRRK